MKHIVILADQLYMIGGINSLIKLKVNYWALNKEYELTIITTEQKNRSPFYELDKSIKLVDLGINYDRSKSYLSLSNFPKLLNNYLKLNRWLKNNRADLIIISNHIPVTFFFAFLKTKAKFLKEYHFTQFFRDQRKPSLFSRFEKYIESKLDFQLVLNPEESKYYHSATAVHIPNPIVLGSEEVEISTNRELTVISAGRISSVKRFELLLEIWNELRKYNSSWNLEIYGTGDKSDIENLQRKVIDLELSGSVKILKPINNLSEIMKHKGIYAMTSAQECFPMVLLEAQSAGLPIIAFDCPTGPRNIIKNKVNGILVPMDDRTAYVRELRNLINDEDLRTFIAAKSLKSVQKYSLLNVMNRWESLILSKI
jgi:glycosyltransferase involved in cell wall biosynthesis